MASRQQIKRRIGSVRNTRQITRAMQLVAASKMRRAQDAVAGPRQFSMVAREMLTQLRRLTARPVKQRLIIAISSDRGLAGAYDSNVIRRLIQEVKADRDKSVNTSIIAIGRKVTQAIARIEGLSTIAVFNDFPEQPDANTIRPLLNTIFDLFTDEKVDAVDVLYTHFISAINQDVQVLRLLPAGFDDVPVAPEIQYAEVEPSLEELVRSTVVRLLEVQLYQARLDTVAVEYSMRMLAMKNATDNANELIDDLTLEYNNARQAAITQELAEITGGAEALA
jgi:F-type H+-transporting ATPase subunit gamma